MAEVRVKKKVAKGVKIVKRRRKPKQARCALCKKPLHGVPRLVPSRLRKLSLSERRPNRPFGGYVCSRCQREIFKSKAREVSKV